MVRARAEEVRALWSKDSRVRKRSSRGAQKIKVRLWGKGAREQKYVRVLVNQTGLHRLIANILYNRLNLHQKIGPHIKGKVRLNEKGRRTQRRVGRVPLA